MLLLEGVELTRCSFEVSFALRELGAAMLREGGEVRVDAIQDVAIRGNVEIANALADELEHSVLAER